MYTTTMPALCCVSSISIVSDLGPISVFLFPSHFLSFTSLSSEEEEEEEEKRSLHCNVSSYLSLLSFFPSSVSSK